MNHRQRQQGLSLGVLVSRLDGLERLVASAAARERDLEQRVNQLSASLHLAHRKIEALERLRFMPAPPMPQPLPAAPIERVSVAEAARRLDVDGETVKRWIEAGALEGEAVVLPGRTYKRWAVYRHSLDAAADAESVDFVGAHKG